jgi:hypothetical protein
VGDFLELDLRLPRVAAALPLVITASGRRLGAGQATIALTPLVAEVGRIDSAGPLALRAPASLTQRDGAEAEVSWRAEPADAVLHASAGALTAPEPVAGGRLRARFLPPAQRIPRVAFLYATDADGHVIDWIPVRLLGLAEVVSRTTPLASISNTVNGTTFGPVRADSTGRVRMVVEVAPGIAGGTTLSVTAIGNSSETQLDLKPPPMARLFPVCTAPEELAVLAVDEAGGPLPAGDLTASTTVGRLSPLERVLPGLYRAALTELPETMPTGSLIDTEVALAGSVSGCGVRHAGAWPTALELTLDHPAQVAGSGQTIELSVRLIYPSGMAGRAAALTLTPELGELGPPRAEGTGEWRATWRLPDRRAGAATARVEVSLRDRPAVHAAITLALTPGPAARVELSASRTRLRADGASTSTVTARVLDANDNPVTSVTPTASARGALTPFHPGAAGALSAEYTAPLLRQPAGDAVHVRAAGVEAELRLTLLPLAHRFQSHAAAGVVTNFGVLTAPLVRAGVDARLGAERRLVVGVELGVYQGGGSQRDADDLESVSTTVRGVPVLARASYRLLEGRVGIAAGAQAGVIWTRTELSSDSAGEVVITSARPTFGGFAAAELGLGRGALVLEGGYLHATASGAVTGNLAGLTGTLGYQLGF